MTPERNDQWRTMAQRRSIHDDYADDLEEIVDLAERSGSTLAEAARSVAAFKDAARNCGGAYLANNVILHLSGIPPVGSSQLRNWIADCLATLSEE